MNRVDVLYRKLLKISETVVGASAVGSPAGCAGTGEDEYLGTPMSTLDSRAHLTHKTHAERRNAETAVGAFEHVVAGRVRWRADCKTSNLETAILSEEADDTDSDDVSNRINETGGSDQRFDDVDDIQVEEQGRTAVATGIIDTDGVSGDHLL